MTNIQKSERLRELIAELSILAGNPDLFVLISGKVMGDNPDSFSVMPIAINPTIKEQVSLFGKDVNDWLMKHLELTDTSYTAIDYK